VPAVGGRAAKGAFVVIPFSPQDHDESTDHATVNVARDNQTFIARRERPAKGIVELVVVVHEDHAIARAEVMVHLPWEKQDPCEKKQYINNVNII
jgi:hypothetical protein